MSGDAEDVVHERGRGIALRSFGDAEHLELSADVSNQWARASGIPLEAEPYFACHMGAEHSNVSLANVSEEAAGELAIADSGPPQATSSHYRDDGTARQAAYGIVRPRSEVLPKRTDERAEAEHNGSVPLAGADTG